MFEDMLNWLNVGSEATATEGFDATEVAGPTKYVSSPRSESINKRRKEIEDSVIKNLKGNDQKEYGIAKYMSESEDEEEAAKGRELLKKYGKSQPVLDVIFESERWRQSQEIVNNIRARNELSKQNFENGKYDNPLEGEYYETLQNEGALINSGWWDALDFGVGMLGRRLVKTAAENTDFNSDTPEELIARFLDPNITSDQKRRMLTNCTAEQRAAVYSMLSDKAVNASVLEGDYAERIEEIEDMITNPDDTAKWSHGLALLDFAGLSTGFGTRTAVALTKPFARRFSGMTKNADFVKFLKSGAKDILGAETSEIFEGLRAAGMTTDEAYQATNRAMYSAASEYLGWKDGKTLSLEMGEQIKTIGKAGILGFKESGIRASIAADGIVANMIANGDFGSRAGRIWLSEGKSIDLGDDVMKSLRSLSMSGEAPTAENIGRAVWGQSYINAERAAMNESLMITESEKNMLLRAKEIEDNIKLGSEYWLDSDGLVKRKTITDMQTILVDNTIGDFTIPTHIDITQKSAEISGIKLDLSELGKIEARYKELTSSYLSDLGINASFSEFDTSNIVLNINEIVSTETSPIKLGDLASRFKVVPNDKIPEILKRMGVENPIDVANKIIKSKGVSSISVFSVIKKFHDLYNNTNEILPRLGSLDYNRKLMEFISKEIPHAKKYDIYNIQKLLDLHSDFKNTILDAAVEAFGATAPTHEYFLKDLKKAFKEAVDLFNDAKSKGVENPDFSLLLAKQFGAGNVVDRGGNLLNERQNAIITMLGDIAVEFGEDHIIRAGMSNHKPSRTRMANALFDKIFGDRPVGDNLFGSLKDNIFDERTVKILDISPSTEYKIALKNDNKSLVLLEYIKSAEATARKRFKGVYADKESVIDLSEVVLTKKRIGSTYELDTVHKGLKNYIDSNRDSINKMYINEVINGGLTKEEAINKIITDYAYTMDTATSVYEAVRIYRERGANSLEDTVLKPVISEISKKVDSLIKSGESESNAISLVINDKEFSSKIFNTFNEFRDKYVKNTIVKSTVSELYELHKQGKDVARSEDLKEIFRIIDESGGDLNNVILKDEDAKKIINSSDFLASTIVDFKFDRTSPLGKFKWSAGDKGISLKYDDARDYLLTRMFSHPVASDKYKAAKEAYRLQTELASIYHSLLPENPFALANASTNIVTILRGDFTLDTLIHELRHNLTNTVLFLYEDGKLKKHKEYFDLVDNFINNTYMPETIKALEDIVENKYLSSILNGSTKDVPSYVLKNFTIRKGKVYLDKGKRSYKDVKELANTFFNKKEGLAYGFVNPMEMCSTSAEYEAWGLFMSDSIKKAVREFSHNLSGMPHTALDTTVYKEIAMSNKSNSTYLIGNIINWNNVDSNVVTSIAFKDPSLMRRLRFAKDNTDAINIVKDYFTSSFILSLEDKNIRESFSKVVNRYSEALSNGDKIDFLTKENEVLVKGVYDYLVNEKGIKPSNVAEAIDSGRFRKEIKTVVTKTDAFNPLANTTKGKYDKYLNDISKADKEAAMSRLSGVSDDAVVNSIAESHKNFADRAEQKINDGWHQFFDDTMAKPYNPIAQLNPSVPANSSTRAQATFEALSGEEYTSIGLNKDETIMSTFGPSVGEKKQPVDIEEVANLLIENSVDITTDEEKRRLIKDIKEQLSKCNASSVDVSIEGSFERIVGTFSNEANTGFDTVSEAKVMRDSALNELKELGLAEQEISIMGADVNGNLSPIQDGVDYSKYYLQITHSNDISNMFTGSSEAVMKVSGIFDANPLTRFVRDNTASASRIFGEDLIRPLVAGYEKLTGIQDIAFSRDVADFKKAFNKISGNRQNKVYETIMKQNARGVKEGTLFSEKDLRAMGHTSEEIEALTKLWDLNEKIWDYKNLNNARKLKQAGFVAIETDKGTMIGRKVSGKLDTNSKVFEPSTGIEIGVEHVNPDYMDIYEFATDRGSRGTNYFIVPKSVKSRAINWKFDQTMGKIPGYTDMRLKEGFRYVEKDGKTFAVARDTLDAEAYAKKMGWTDGEYVIRGDARGKGTGLGSRSQQRDGIELAGNLTWSDAYINPLEAVDQGLSYAMRQTEITPIIEQAQRNFIQVYGKYTKGVYPTSMSAIEGKDQMANAARSVYNYIERIKGAESKNMIDDAFKATMNHIAENLGKWALESGGAMADVYALGERAALNMARMNPLTWSRHRVSQFYIAAHPIRQFLLQGVQLSNAMAVDAKSVLSGKMMSQMIDLTLAATGTKNVSRENAHMFDLFKRMGLMSSESSVAWIQEALKVAPGSKWDGAMEKLGKGALYGEKMQVLGQACCEYNKTVRQFGKEWFNNKKNFDSFIEKVRITTGSQNPAERMPWENGVLGVIFQFVQSPWKMNQLIFSKQIPLRTRAGIALNELAVFGLGTYGTALVYDNVVGKQFGATLDDDTREIIKGGLFDNAVAKVFGMHFDTKNFAPTNYSDIVDWLVKACGYKETEAAKYIAGDWKKNDALKHEKSKSYQDNSFLSQAGERMSVPVASFAKYRLAPLISDVWGFMWGTEDNEQWSEAKAIDVAKDLVNMFSGGKAALNAYIASTTGNYLNRKGAHLKTGMDNRQALGMLLFNPEVTPEERSNAYKELAYKDPDAYLTTAWDSAMHHVAGKLMNENLDKVETSEYIERMFGAMQILRQSWTNGDPKKEKKLKEHIEKRLKEAQEDPVSSHAWVLNWFTKRLEKGQKYYQDAMMRFKEQDPRAYQTVHDRIREINRAQRIDFEEEEE